MEQIHKNYNLGVSEPKSFGSDIQPWLFCCFYMDILSHQTLNSMSLLWVPLAGNCLPIQKALVCKLLSALLKILGPKWVQKTGSSVRKWSSKRAYEGSPQNIEFTGVSTTMDDCDSCIGSIPNTQYYPPGAKLPQGKS